MEKLKRKPGQYFDTLTTPQMERVRVYVRKHPNNTRSGKIAGDLGLTKEYVDKFLKEEERYEVL